MTKSMRRIHTGIVFGGVVMLLAFLGWMYPVNGGVFLAGKAH